MLISQNLSAGNAEITEADAADLAVSERLCGDEEDLDPAPKATKNNATLGTSSLSDSSLMDSSLNLKPTDASTRIKDMELQTGVSSGDKIAFPTSSVNHSIFIFNCRG